MELTPGLRLILRNAPTLTFPPLLVYFTANVLQIPLILTVLAYICSVPLYVLARYMWNCWVLGQEMDRLGAQAVPLWTGQWPGHVDLLLKLYKDWIVKQSFQLSHTNALNFLLSRMATHVTVSMMPPPLLASPLGPTYSVSIRQRIFQIYIV
jgi:hypothetical protein